jgi:hypothetical protein
MDLLQSVPTAVATSSAYRDSERQVPLLFDGDLATAWNSRSGELAGAWIDVRVPAGATGTSIAITAGFVRVGENGDLFTGNHRVARVKVSRDGQEVLVHALDTNSRELQTVPVTGPGGVYRIEVAEVLAGSRDDWQETCISELRVMGHAPGAREGGGFPRFAVGALPEPAEAVPAPDRAEFGAVLRRRATWFAREWGEHDDAVMSTQLNTGEPDITRPEAAGFRLKRGQILRRVAELVEPIDAAAAAPLRRLAALAPRAEGRGEPWAWSLRQHDVAVPLAAFDVAVEWLGDDGARCHVAKARARVRMTRLSYLLAWELETGDLEVMEAEMMGENPGNGGHLDGVRRVWDVIGEVLNEWPRNAQPTARRILRLRLPERSDNTAEWMALRTQLETADRVCGWE